MRNSAIGTKENNLFIKGDWSMEEFLLGGDIMFTVARLFIFLVFAIILFNVLKGIFQWGENNRQPHLTSAAKVVGKRTSIHGGGNTRAYNHYFATFEFTNGNRTEFQLKDEEYGMLAEGDSGDLQFQGTRYLGFTRNKRTGENSG